MKRAAEMLDEFQRWLDRVNERFGAAGAVFAVIFWLAVLVIAIKAILFDF